MKTIVIALSATFAFAATALSAEMAYKRPETDTSASVKPSSTSAATSKAADDETSAASTAKTEPKPKDAARSKSQTATDESAAEPKDAADKGKAKTAETKYPSGYHAAKWHGGHGATWRTGANAYGFSGFFGGCRYRGSASPRGYDLERVC